MIRRPKAVQPRTAKAQLSALATNVYSTIFNMTPRQRGAALRALEGLTQTNCGWSLYEMRTVLLGFVEAASSFTELKARKRAQAKRRAA